MTQIDNRQDGFTLVEVLVSLVLLSLIVIYASSTLSTLGRLRHVNERHDDQGEVRAVITHLRNIITDTRVVNQTGNSAEPSLLFAGTRDRLVFAAVSDGQRDTGGLYRVEVYVDTSNNLVEQRSLLGQSATGVAVTLLQDVTQVQFSYIKEDNRSGVSEALIDSWTDPLMLPRAIQIEVTFSPNVEKNWPAVLIPVVASR